MAQIKAPPTTISGILEQLGPGLIISANIVGSGELIVTTKLGAEVGFTLLWFIILGCMIKVLLQVELGRYTIARSKTTLEAMNGVPGPRWKVSWLVWCWIFMFVATFFQLSGMVGGIVQILQAGGAGWSETWIALGIMMICALLLFVGRYKFIEKFSTIAVAAFTLFTIFAVFSLYWTDYGITSSQLADGLSFRLPDNFVTAFAAFGVIGVGASELIYYPYWCLEKGYAAYVGPHDGTPEWTDRARGWLRVMRWDAWVSMVIYTGATVAFYLLGAAVLNSQNLVVENDEMILTLSNIYEASFAQPGLWIFLIGAFVVLFSTIFISTASNGRLTADVMRLFGWIRIETEAEKKRVIRNVCLILPFVYYAFYITVKKPVHLVFAGAIAQGLILPLLCFAALYYHYREREASIRAGKAWITGLWVTAALMTVVGAYQVVTEIGSRLGKPTPAEASPAESPAE